MDWMIETRERDAACYHKAMREGVSRSEESTRRQTIRWQPPA